MDELPARPTSEELRTLLVSDHSRTRARFVEAFPEDLGELSSALATCFCAYRDLDEIVGTNRRLAYVTAFVFTALNSVLTSSQLFLTGMLIPAGHLMRQYGEATAMALLCSSPDLDTFSRLEQSPGEFPAHDSLRLVNRRRTRALLDISADAWQEFMVISGFYDKYSHASELALASQFMFSRSGWLAIGGEFDDAKRPQYQIELRRRVSASHVLTGLTQELYRRALPKPPPPHSTGAPAA